MAETTDNSSLANTPDPQPENPAGELFETKNTELTNPNPEPDNMEVHHHAHAHGKKNFKTYLWEFVMLFLAVFCGFLAEYYLEHRIEKERGKQFIESFYEDLKKDTARISFYTDYDQEKINGFGNLGNCYDNIMKDQHNASCMLDLIKYSSINRPFMRTDRTLKQLANAGGYRLLKKADADSILSYDEEFNNFQDFQSTVFQDVQNTLRNTINLLVNFKANEQMFTPQPGKPLGTGNFTIQAITAPIFFSNDKNLLNRYFNELQLYQRVTYNHIRMLQNIKNKQARLIIYFKSKYDLE
ncbi:MAG: hypothetical protein V4557_04795 [Bacteroidota bacterium]